VSTFTQLGDRYDVGQVIGRGGMAEVYEGTDRRLNRRVAIKVLRPDLARDPMFQERFRREAQSAAGLNHPNIVAIYDTGEDFIGDGENQVSVPYIVMEYVDGETLRHHLNNGPRILPERALEVIAGVLAALDYAHRHGIVHRDIKPANIMINTNGDAKVMDFGIARAMTDAATAVTASSSVMGTAQYLSPEQARGELVDARSDLYSTGCVLYELLVGKPPFNGDSAVAIAYQHVNEMPPAPSVIDSEVPNQLDLIVLTALAKLPSNRYRSAAEMRADVERALAGMPIFARGLTQTELDATTANTMAIPVMQDSSDAPQAQADNPGKRFKWLYVFIAATVAALTLFVLGSRLLPSGPETVAVPDLKSKTITEATSSLTAAGLIIGQEIPQADNEIPKGIIIGQDPAAGELLEVGQAVNIIVSAGKEQTSVPDLVGLTSKEIAKTTLEEAQLVLGRVTPEDSDKPEGTVLEQDIEPNTNVDIGTLISITVSNGKSAVPDVVGMTETAAKNKLLNAGFKVEIITQENGTVDAGTVVSQSPEAKETAVKGTTITIVVAVTPKPISCPDGSTVPWDETCPEPPIEPVPL
jgi:serine/threonine protein kinase/beta-lactam-binding protein with PASTA domain